MIDNEYNTQVSNKYAPKNLTMIPERKRVENDLFKDNNDNHFALLVRVGQNKNDNLAYHEGHILLSLFKSFRMVMQYIKV
jgi:hypothetical protein